MLKSLLITGSVLIAAPVTILTVGAVCWARSTRTLRANLEAARVPMEPQVVDFGELEGLPAPVQRYFRRVLKDGQALVTGVRVQHHGTFNMGETADQWKQFTSDQRVITRRPGFDRDARIRMMPGLTVRVRDAYLAGEARLFAALLDLFPVADLRGGSDVAEGELMRFWPSPRGIRPHCFRARVFAGRLLTPTRHGQR